MVLRPRGAWEAHPPSFTPLAPTMRPGVPRSAGDRCSLFQEAAEGSGVFLGKPFGLNNCPSLLQGQDETSGLWPLPSLCKKGRAFPSPVGPGPAVPSPGCPPWASVTCYISQVFSPLTSTPKQRVWPLLDS